MKLQLRKVAWSLMRSLDELGAGFREFFLVEGIYLLPQSP
jgi:hypothetical protein